MEKGADSESLPSGTPLCCSLCHGPLVLSSSEFSQENSIAKTRVPRLYQNTSTHQYPRLASAMVPKNAMAESKA